MVTPDWWATYQFTDNQWLLQGWEIADGSVTKIAETQVDLWKGNYSNPNWQLVEHPDGGVALIGLRGLRYNSSDAIGMSHYGVRNGEFVLIDTFEVPLEGSGWDLMYCTRDYVYFVSQSASYGLPDAPWEIRSLRDLSQVVAGSSIAQAVVPLSGLQVSLAPYYTIGNTLWFRIWSQANSQQQYPLKGMQMQQDGTFVIVDAKGADHAMLVGGYYDRFVNNGLAHYPRRDRWAVFRQQLIGYPTGTWQYELTIQDENGNTVYVQFPVLDDSYYTYFFGDTPPVGIQVTQLFYDEPAANGSQGAHWFGYAYAGPHPAHRFSGSFTIPNVVNGSAVITTTWQDLGEGPIPSVWYPGYYDNTPPMENRGGMVTSSSVGIFISDDSAYDNYDYDLHAWYQMNRDGTYVRLETVDDGNYYSGWGGHSLSTMSPAVLPIPRVAPALSAVLEDIGQRFD